MYTTTHKVTFSSHDSSSFFSISFYMSRFHDFHPMLLSLMVVIKQKYKNKNSFRTKQSKREKHIVKNQSISSTGFRLCIQSTSSSFSIYDSNELKEHQGIYSKYYEKILEIHRTLQVISSYLTNRFSKHTEKTLKITSFD